MTRDNVNRDDVTCDDVEVALIDEARSSDVEQHLQSCARCRASAEVLGAAALGPPSASDRAMLAAFAPQLASAWHTQQQRRSAVSRASGYGVAALMGALAATVFFLLRPLPPDAAPEAPLAAAAPAELSALPDWEGDDSAPVDESAFFEVSWPTTVEGDAP